MISERICPQLLEDGITAQEVCKKELKCDGKNEHCATYQKFYGPRTITLRVQIHHGEVTDEMLYGILNEIAMEVESHEEEGLCEATEDEVEYDWELYKNDPEKLLRKRVLADIERQHKLAKEYALPRDQWTKEMKALGSKELLGPYHLGRQEALESIKALL